jgi:aspartate racemase
MKRIGLLGGIGPASTRLYYDLLVDRARRLSGHSPEIVLFSLDFELFTHFENTNDVAYVDMIVDGCRVLRDAGADVLAMAANSPHARFDAVVSEVGRPLVHIAEAVCRQAAMLGVERPLLLGIPVTLRSAFYREIGQRHGLEVQIPDPADHDLLRRVVFEELTRGRIRPASRDDLLALLVDRPVDGLILGCTELTLLIEQGHVHVPVLDSTSIHVDAILAAASTTSTSPPLSEGSS